MARSGKPWKLPIYAIVFLLALYRLGSVQIDYFFYTDYLILFPWSFDFLQRGHAFYPSHVLTLRSWVLFWNLIHHDYQNSKPDSTPDSKPSHVQYCWQKKKYTLYVFLYYYLKLVLSASAQVPNNFWDSTSSNACQTRRDDMARCQLRVGPVENWKSGSLVLSVFKHVQSCYFWL